MSKSEETEGEKIRKHNEYLIERLRQEQRQNKNLAKENKRLESIAEDEHRAFMRTHDALNLLYQDAQRVMRENGVAEQYEELVEWRNKYMTLLGRRQQWKALTRRAVEGKVEATRRATDQAMALVELRDALTRMQQERERAVAAAEEIIATHQAQRDRMAEQCRLWKRGELDTMTTIAGIAAELDGHKLPEPGAWERAQAVRNQTVQAHVRLLQEDLEEVNEALRQAGIEHPLGARGVADLASQRDSAAEPVDEWKRREAAAHGAAVTLAKLLDAPEAAMEYIRNGVYTLGIQKIQQDREKSGE